jgi:glycosyltransferase involved in cell wall biosynthesis
VKKIDVVIPTKNSEKPCWKDCLKSIKNSDIPLNNLIIIDNNSTDKTIKIVKKTFPKAVLINEPGNLAIARTRGIQLVKTKYFAFIDSDVIIPDNWYCEISKYEKYGNALESWNWNWLNETKRGIKTKMKKEYSTSPRTQNDIARTIATLIETRFVKGIKIPEDLYQLEDAYIRRYLEKKGGIWVKTGVKIDHYPHDWKFSKFGYGYLKGKYGFANGKLLFALALKNSLFRNHSAYSTNWSEVLGFLFGKLNLRISKDKLRSE